MEIIHDIDFWFLSLKYTQYTYISQTEKKRFTYKWSNLPLQHKYHIERNNNLPFYICT